MNWPTSQDYNEAVQDSANSFSDPSLQQGEVVVNAIGLPVPRSGNFADVYQFKDGNGKLWAIKCFTRKVPGLKERYAKIDEQLAKARLPFAVGFKFIEEGIRVRGQWFPLLKMEWVEGFTLNDFVADNLAKPHYLHALMQMWAKLAGRLRDGNMAHADLQHGNVLLVPGATPQKLGLKLIDYDGMWVPTLSEFHSGEVGHPNFQHPLRLKDKLYNGDVDRFPHLVVAAGLRATLVGGKAIWDRFDNSDNLLFKEADLRDPGSTPIFKALWELNDPVLRTLVGHIALSVKQPLRKTPWLDDVLFEAGGPKLTGEQEKQVCDMLGVVTQQAATSKGLVAPRVQQEFNVFEFLGDEEDVPRRDGAGRRSAPPNVRKPKGVPKKSKLPFLIGGGAFAFLLAIGALVIGMNLKNRKVNSTPEVVQNSSDDQTKPPDRGTLGSTTPPIITTTKDGESVPIPVKKDPEASPALNGRGMVVEIGPLPGGKDYLFVRVGDPSVYLATAGPPRQVRALGRHQNEVHQLSIAADGSRALTVDKAGELRVWTINAAAMTAESTEKIQSFPNIANKLYSMEAFTDRVVVRELATQKEETVTVGRRGQPVKEGFLYNLKNVAQLADRLGQAMTGEVDVFEGRLVVQLFEGGTQFYHRAGTQTHFVWHDKRNPAPAIPSKADPAPASKVLPGSFRDFQAMAIARDGKRALTKFGDTLYE